MASFIPRRVFPNLDSLPRSYFLGHHRAGLEKMKTILSNVDLIIECRDSRIPITSRNPLFEENLAGKERVIVQTKHDLVKDVSKRSAKIKTVSVSYWVPGSVIWAYTYQQQIKATIQEWHHPTRVIFSNNLNAKSVRPLLEIAHQLAVAKRSLLPFNIMVVGMPNVGKSSILNNLRNLSLHLPKAASTGAQPGVTRRIATGVKILEANNERPGVYLIDTPGVFIPYVPNAESMLKLALCGCVKDTIIPPTILADYLLFQLNLNSSEMYEEYASPTNEITEFLSEMASKIGRLRRGGDPDIEATALWIIQRWRNGRLGKFLLDDVSLANFEEERRASESTLYASLSQGHKQDQKLRSKARPPEAG